MRNIFFCAALMLGMSVSAQSAREWETYLREVITVEDVGSAAWEEMYEQMCELDQHPINLNQASREQLEQLPFLSAQQVEEIMAYLYQYGPMKSVGELQMIRSLDYQRRRLLTYFIEIDDGEQKRDYPNLKTMAQYGRHELMATAKVPLYERKGDREAYKGWPYRHWMRYQFSYGDYVKAGFVGAQDAGEPFFANKNRMGYDYYSYYLQLKNWGRLASLVLGKYRVSMGMGLIANNSFAMGKLSSLQNLGRATSTLRAHSSRSSADYLQGVGATLTITKGLSATGFLSYRAMDATLNKDGTAATIVTTGYHRTETELEKKNNLKNTSYGGTLRYQGGGFHAGLNVVGTHLSRELKPNTTVLYRQHAAQGTDFLNFSADYGYVNPRFAFNGETAMNKDGALATINSLSLQCGGQVSLMALYRFYSFRYTSLYGNSFSDGGTVQNESGVYLGVNWQPSPRWKVMAYGDYAYFPWAKYQVSQSSHAFDNLLQVSYLRNNWTLEARYRLKLREKDNEDKTTLQTITTHRGRLSLSYDGSWSSRTQLDYSQIASGQQERGWMVSQSLGYNYRWLRLSSGLGYFHTDSYDSRVYLYESGPLYNYGFSQYSGEGIRYWLMARGEIGKRLTVTAKFGTTDYFDRSVIGSSYQQIDGSSQSDVDLQVRWKF
ncbi:MAG: helix-hairpin-helix domain-containing protein [Prevotella sp.]|nr:helix-hairpin-helix domain-containing protein [Prevotella sp.]